MQRHLTGFNSSLTHGIVAGLEYNMPQIRTTQALRALLWRNDIADKHTTHTPRLALTIRKFSIWSLVHEHGEKKGVGPQLWKELWRRKKEENVKLKIKEKDTKELTFPKNKGTFIFCWLRIHSCIGTPTSATFRVLETPTDFGLINPELTWLPPMARSTESAWTERCSFGPRASVTTPNFFWLLAGAAGGIGYRTLSSSLVYITLC